MELDHLRAFVAVADAGGFRPAAVIVHSTQPTLSRQVRALEDELGRTLFDRLGRRVALTPFGHEILERAHVGVCPGIDFGEAGEGWLRFCCAASEESISEALERLGRVLPEPT